MNTDIRLAPNATMCYDARCTEIQDLLRDVTMLTGKLDCRENVDWGHATNLLRVVGPLRKMREQLISMTRDL